MNPVVRGIAILIACAGILAFAFCFAWFVVPPVPISVLIVAGFAIAIWLLVYLTRPRRS